MMKNLIKIYKDILTMFFTVVALFFSGISLIRSCSSESELKKIGYSLSSIEHRPRIKLSNPQIHNFKFSSDSILPEYPENNDSVGIAYGKIDLEIKLNATNIGNSSSKIIGWIIADTLTDKPFLKDLIKVC